MCSTHYKKIAIRMQMDKHERAKAAGALKYGYSSSGSYGNLDVTSSVSSSSYSFGPSQRSYTDKYRAGLETSYERYPALNSVRTPDRESPIHRIRSIESPSAVDRITGCERSSLSTVDRITSFESKSSPSTVDPIAAYRRKSSPSASHHSYQDSRALLLDAEPDELRSLADVEAKIKQAAKFCKTEGCHNYGNIRKIGYCNECYDKRYKKQ